jgi:hypothetical protein
VNPHEIDGEDDSCWQVSMLELKPSQVKLEQEKWDDQKQHQPIRIELENENRAFDVELKKNLKQQQQQQKDLDYKFDLMGKYKNLHEQGFDNHQIVGMIPAIRPILDSTNMPVHLQLSPDDDGVQVVE